MENRGSQNLVIIVNNLRLTLYLLSKKETSIQEILFWWFHVVIVPCYLLLIPKNVNISNKNNINKTAPFQK